MQSWPLFRLNQPPYFDLTLNEFNYWYEEMLHMEKEYLLPDGYTRDSLFYSLSYLLVRGSRLSVKDLSKMDNARDLLSAFQELIEKNFLSLKMPKDYAARLNVTPNHLNAVCKKRSGKSAGELIRQRILLEAKRLIAHTDMTVSEIAYHLKFEDNSTLDVSSESMPVHHQLISGKRNRVKMYQLKDTLTLLDCNGLQSFRCEEVYNGTSPHF